MGLTPFHLVTSVSSSLLPNSHHHLLFQDETFTCWSVSVTAGNRWHAHMRIRWGRFTSLQKDQLQPCTWGVEKPQATWTWAEDGRVVTTLGPEGRRDGDHGSKEEVPQIGAGSVTVRGANSSIYSLSLACLKFSSKVTDSWTIQRLEVTNTGS